MMNLIGSDFVKMVSDRRRRCSQCGGKIKKGDTCLLSIRGGKVKKIVCGESCRQEFDAEFWEAAAQRHHPREFKEMDETLLDLIKGAESMD